MGSVRTMNHFNHGSTLMNTDKAPNSKLQAPGTHQTSSSKRRLACSWPGLKFGAWCLSGAWCLVFGVSLVHAASTGSAVNPPPGFTPLFNGEDLSGWRGGDTFDHRKLLAMPADQREAQLAKWTASMKAHWTVQDGELVNDGQGAYASTEKDYGDFELLLEYKTVAKADSGIYLRGCPQVQIWDYTEKEKFPLGADKGSGGLWNNSPGAPGKDPLVLADKPFCKRNTVRRL